MLLLFRVVCWFLRQQHPQTETHPVLSHLTGLGRALTACSAGMWVLPQQPPCPSLDFFLRVLMPLI